MKTLLLLGTLVLAGMAAAAQEQQPLVVLHKNWLDSLSGNKYQRLQRTLPPEILASLKKQLIMARSGAAVYNARPDNMPVLKPDMGLVEQMPGSSLVFTPAPPSKMPNPLYKPRLRNHGIK